jgi:hypothetical protein
VKITTKGAKLLFEVLPGCYHVLNGAIWPLDGKTKKALITILDYDPEARSQHGPAQGALLETATPEPEPEAPIAAPALNPVAGKRAKKTLAQRLRRAAAKASVQWRGEPELTAAAE